MQWYAFFLDGTSPNFYKLNGMVSLQMPLVSHVVFVRVESFHLFLFTLYIDDLL